MSTTDFSPAATLSAFGGSEMNGRSSILRSGSVALPSSYSFGVNYSFEVQKFLRDVLKRRLDVPAARVLPKTHLLAQLVLQEQSERELFALQERVFRQQLSHKRDEDRLRREEHRVAQRNREKLEELKRKHAAELSATKSRAALFHKHIDADVKERLRVVSLLQPRAGPAAAALAEVKSESGGCRLLPELMEEERRVVKALKADSRFNRGAKDGGALPHWLRACVAGSFNVAAIVQDAPFRAAVVDAIAVSNPALRKVVVVRHAESGEVVAWVHVRTGSDVVAVATELAKLPAPQEFSPEQSAGVVWTKEDVLDLNRKAKAASTSDEDLADIIGVSSASFSYEGITTFEFSKKDIENIGQVATA